MKIKFNSEGLKESRVSEWLLRFGFGGAIAVMAGLITKYWGPEVGGLFLAFPSILPATLALIVHHRNRREAADDAYGAGLGSVGLICFSVVAYLTLGHWPFALSLIAATVIWLVASIALWFFVEW